MSKATERSTLSAHGEKVTSPETGKQIWRTSVFLPEPLWLNPMHRHRAYYSIYGIIWQWSRAWLARGPSILPCLRLVMIWAYDDWFSHIVRFWSGRLSIGATLIRSNILRSSIIPTFNNFIKNLRIQGKLSLQKLDFGLVFYLTISIGTSSTGKKLILKLSQTVWSWFHLPNFRANVTPWLVKLKTTL